MAARSEHPYSFPAWAVFRSGSESENSSLSSDWLTTRTKKWPQSSRRDCHNQINQLRLCRLIFTRVCLEANRVILKQGLVCVFGPLLVHNLVRLLDSDLHKPTTSNGWIHFKSNKLSKGITKTLWTNAVEDAVPEYRAMVERITIKTRGSSQKGEKNLVQSTA